MWAVIYRDLWGPVWPNLAASGICLPVAFLWHHRRLRADLDVRDAAHAENHARTRALICELAPTAPTAPEDET